MVYVHKEYPAMRWSPEGEVRVFNRAEDVPAGWTDKHPNHDRDESPAPAPKVVDTMPPLEELRAELTRREVEFKPNAGRAALNKLLQEHRAAHGD